MGQPIHRDTSNTHLTNDRGLKTLSVTDTEKIDFSVVIPVYNSQGTLSPLCESILTELKDFSVQIILVNDKSYDASWEKIASLKEQFPTNITAINLAKNAGQHAAIFCGFHFAKGKYIITIDDDLQTHPREILKLIAKEKETNADLIYGVYQKKEHAFIRNLGSRMLGSIFSTHASTPQQGSSFKLIKKELIEKIIPHNSQNIFIDELLGWHSGYTDFIAVKHEKRQIGKSGYSIIGLMRLTAHIVINYTVVPLKLITYLGILSSLISFGVGSFYLYQKIIGDSEIELGFTSLIVAVFFSTGLILFSLGIIGEYLNRIFMMQMGKPPYKIQNILE
ncbi:MAG: glycosyltransferase family 2 protein [Chitinophagales bacterium]